MHRSTGDGCRIHCPPRWRHYARLLQCISPASSDGETSGWSLGILARLGYAFEVASGTRLIPFARFTAPHLELDGWTETSGPFAAAFSDIESTAQRTHMGIEVTQQWTAATLVWGSLAWAHRLDDHSATISCQIIVLFFTDRDRTGCRA